MLDEVLKRFEQHAPVTVMGRMALEHALDPTWVDAVFDEHRQRQYSRELLFSTVVKLVSLVSLGLRPSLHAAAKKMEDLPVSVAALYDKVRRTEPAILRALVRGSAERLGPVVGPMAGAASLPGWQLRVIDGNHLPGSEKRLKPLRERRGAALPGHALVVYDPDRDLATDMVACEDAYDNERMGMKPLLECAQAGQLWIGDRNFCSGPIMKGWEAAGAHFIVREHGTHPRLTGEGELKACGRVETGEVYEQPISIAECPLGWRRIELHLDKPTENGDAVIRLWSNLPSGVGAQRIAELYRKRWRIEGMFQRLESVLKSEITTLGRPRAALLGFAVALLAYNILATLKRCVEFAHQEQLPQLEVSSYYLALDLRNGYEGMLVALPASHWQQWANVDPPTLTEQLLRIAHNTRPAGLAAAKRTPKVKKTKEYVDVLQASAHFSTYRVLRDAKKRP
jgi:IS4 transposase